MKGEQRGVEVAKLETTRRAAHALKSAAPGPTCSLMGRWRRVCA